MSKGLGIFLAVAVPLAVLGVGITAVKAMKPAAPPPAAPASTYVAPKPTGSKTANVLNSAAGLVQILGQNADPISGLLRGIF